LIDQANHHVFQPLLYQVATSILTPASIATPIRQILGHQTNATVFLAKVHGIDTRSSVPQFNFYALLQAKGDTKSDAKKFEMVGSSRIEFS
jgi:hypothetical protein